MNDQIENVMSPMGYLKIFFRRKELLLIPAFAGLIVGICAGLILPKQYQSSTTILVEEGKTDNPLFSNLAVASDVRQRMGTIRESMLGWHSLVKLVQRLKLDKDVRSPHEFEKLILGIRSKIFIRLRGHNIIQLSYLSDDPELTKQVVENIADIFIARNVEIQNENTSDAIQFIEQQLHVYKGKIKSSEIAELKDHLHALLTDSTELHPIVKQLREQIKLKEKELKEENLTYTETDPLTAQSTNPLIQQIQKALTNIEGGKIPSQIPASTGEKTSDDFYKVMLIDTLDNVMARDVNVNNNLYTMLLQRLETAKITQRLQTSKEGTKYTVLDPARIAFKPVKPNKVLVGLGGLFAGAFLGITLVVLAEFLDKSFIDVEEATQYFGQPLLGAISKINTATTLRAEKEKQYWLYALTLILGIVAIIVTKSLSNFLG